MGAPTRDDVERALLKALRVWADGFTATDVDPASLKEPAARDRLQAVLNELMDSRAEVAPELSGWTRGGVDLVIDGPEAALAWIEMKWLKNGKIDELHNCVWDAAKIATALRVGKTRYGYLLAGAPVSEWERAPRLKCRPAAELLETSSHSGRELFDGYPTWWAAPGWPNPPTLPTPVSTVAVGSVELGDWIVKLSRVEAPGSDWYAL